MNAKGGIQQLMSQREPGLGEKIDPAPGDFTGRQTMEGALRESEYRFRQLAESLPQVVWTTTPEGICDYLSPQWFAYTGLGESEDLGLAWIEQIHPDDRQTLAAEWGAAVRKGEQFHFEVRIRRHDGQYRWFDARAIPLRNVQGQIQKWFVSSTDVHEAREMREALETERRRLEKLVSLAPAVFCSFELRPDGSASFPYARADILDLYGLHPDDLKKDAALLFAQVHAEDSAPLLASIELSAKTMSVWRAQFRIHHPQKGERWIEGCSTPTPAENGCIVWHGFLTDISERKRTQADQEFLLKLGVEMQTASGPATIAALATRLVADYFDVTRCSLSSISVPRNEANLLHETTRHGYAPPPPGPQRLSAWGSKPWLDLLGSGKIVAVADTASDPITAPYYHGAFGPMDIGALVAVPLRREGHWVAVLTLATPEQRVWSRRELDLAQAAAEKIWPAYEAARAQAAERAMHATLAASEERLRLALQTAEIGIWEQNPQTEEIFWDDRSKQILGLTGAKVDRAASRACIHPDDRESARLAGVSLRDPAGSGHFDIEFRAIKADTGKLRYVHAQGQSFFEGEGANRKAVRSLGTFQDITAFKEKERALQMANEELEEFAYAAAHDLRAPLRVIDNATRWLEEDLEQHLSADTRENMKLVRGRVRRMEKLLDDLLEYSRIGTKTDPGFREMVAGSELIDNIWTLLSPQGFTVKVSPEFAAIRVPRMPLQQIFMNLISNSIKHHDKATGCIEVTVEDSGAFYLFGVKDDGPGIAERFHERIFKMFQTLRPKDQVEGSGMGLALVRKNIEVFGGRLRLESAEGKGCTFRFTWRKQPHTGGDSAAGTEQLPQRPAKGNEEMAQTPAAAPAPPIPAGRKGERVIGDINGKP